MNDQSNLPALTAEKAGEIMEAVIARGDLAKLEPQERAKYYTRVCTSIGLNPLTKPFEYITLNGKLTLYARKDATDQLRKIYGVSVTDMSETERDGVAIITVKVRDASGRTDMAKGAVSLKGLQGEALANGIMKAETKAKRRATLSICGLGFLDETEVETLPDAVPRYTKTKQASKDLYAAMEAEVHTLTSAAQASEWLERNADRLKLLPHDWEDFLRTACHDLISSTEPPVEWTDDTPPEWDSAWEKLGPVKQAGVLCSDSAFHRFLSVANADLAAKVVRDRCKVKSRAELATNDEAAKLWRALVADYRAWQREPDLDLPVVNQSQIAGSQQVRKARPALRSDGPNSGFDSRDGGHLDTSHRPTSPKDATSDAADQGAPADDAGRGDAAGASEGLSLEDEAREAAKRGVFQAFWNRISAADKRKLEPLGPELRKLMDEAGA